MLSKTTNVIILFLAAFIIFSFWYNQKYSMSIINEAEFNETSLNHKLLIVSQGSSYKNRILDILIDFYKAKNLHIKVIDVTQLDYKNKALENYDAIVIFHTWEMMSPPSEVSQFVASNPKNKRVFTLATSGGGDQKIIQVDGISSASVIENADNDAIKIINWINKRIPSLI